MSERLHGAWGSARRTVAAIDRAPDGGEAAYLAALEGDFQIRPCGGRGNGCVRQVVTQPPVRWLPAAGSPETA